MGRKDIESTLNEVRILCSVENEYVVGYKDAFLDKNDTELCIGTYHLNSGFRAEVPFLHIQNIELKWANCK